MPPSTQFFKDQVIAGTQLDRQNERLEKSYLEEFLEQHKGERMPLYGDHDASKPSTGYYDNLRLIPDPSDTSEWQLIADITLCSGSLEGVVGGFSISFTATIYEGMDQELGAIYLPYPTYNDVNLVASMRSDRQGGVGKWIRKGVDLSDVALIIAGILIKPLWDQVYEEFIKRRIANVLDYFKKSRSLLKERGISVEYVQVVEVNSIQVRIHFIPSPGNEEVCLSPLAIVNGLRVAHDYLVRNPTQPERRIDRVVMQYVEESESYRVEKVTYASRTSVKQNSAETSE